MGYAPREDFQGYGPAAFQTVRPQPADGTQPGSDGTKPGSNDGTTGSDQPGSDPTQPGSTDTTRDQPGPDPTQPSSIGSTQPGSVDSSPVAVGVAAVVISRQSASVMNLGDVMDISVSLTGPATTDTSLYPILYQALDNGSYSPADQSVFLFPPPPIKVPAGSTTTGFQIKYQNPYLSPPGNYVVSIVTAEALHVADLAQLPVTKFASFIIQSNEVGDILSNEVADRLQKAMDSNSKLYQTLSNIMKKIEDNAWALDEPLK
jgi:hypothetical protein